MLSLFTAIAYLKAKTFYTKT